MSRSTLLPSPKRSIAMVTMLNEMKKHELIEAIRSHGEEPPSQWRVLELKSRLRELEAENGSLRSRGKSDLEQWVVKINAVKKKSELQAFIQEELKGKITGNETKDQLMKMGMDLIYQISVPEARDPVGFGEHAPLSYLELWQTQLSYCDWVKKTDAEGTSSIRLRRLARWLRQDKSKESKMEKTSPRPQPTTKSRPAPKTTRGYQPQPSGSSDGHSEVLKSLEQNQKMMESMLIQMENLKHEVEDLKEGRPHKKTSEGVSSFSVMSDSPST